MTADPIVHSFNELPDAEARSALARCCAAQRWVEGLLEGRPYARDADLFAAAERVWWALEPGDWLEAFAAHPRIGARSADAWSRAEQSGMDAASAATRLALVQKNAEYEARFGHVFLICATDKSAVEMLTQLERRLGHEPSAELRIAAAEQAKITRLRLERMGKL